MYNTPKANQPHITLFGERNAGKSSLINALLNQELSIVSSVPGTTTDPVHKSYELQPVGPVVFTDTAGWDDIGDIGNLRKERTLKLIQQTDIALVLLQPDSFDDKQLETLAKTLDNVYLVISQSDTLSPKTLNSFKNKLSKNRTGHPPAETTINRKHQQTPARPTHYCRPDSTQRHGGARHAH